MPRDRVDLELKNFRAFDTLAIEYRVVIIILKVKYFFDRGKNKGRKAHTDIKKI